MNFTFEKVILGIIFAFEKVNWCEKWRSIRNFPLLPLCKQASNEQQRN